MTYTYRDMLAYLNTFTQEQLDLTATVFDSDEDEFYAIDVDNITREADVLDADHPYFVIKLKNVVGEN